MPLIKNITAISYSSQDPKHPLSALLRGSGAWLCSPDDRSGRLSADLQLDRALTISYIDVGNHNSVTLSVEVSRSCNSSGTTCALLPTVALMTPQEFRGQHPNCKAVRMFRAEDLDKRALKEQWDRVRVTCCQPFKRGVQFGLSFLKLYTSEVLQPLTLHPPLSSGHVPSSCSVAMPAAPAAGCANFAASDHQKIGSDRCALPKKIPHGRSDENILQRLENSSSTSNFSVNKNMSLTSSGLVQGASFSTSPLTFANNMKGLPRKSLIDQNSHSVLMKENKGKEADKANKCISPRPSAAQRFRSALDKLCSTQGKASPTVVAKQKFMEKFGASTNGGSPAEDSDGRSPAQTSGKDKSSGPCPGKGAGAATENPKTAFEYESLEFLISLNLQRDQILQLKVADVRIQFEAHRGKLLTRPERLCFKNLALDYCARRLDTLDFDSQSGRTADCQSSSSTAAAAVSGQRRRGCGISDTSDASRSGGGSSCLDLGVPNDQQDSRRDNGRKFTFKKFEFESSNTSNSSPVNGVKPARFNRAVSKSPMPFYDDYDYARNNSAAEKLKGSSAKNAPKISPKRREPGKKRKKEEPKPVADGEWVRSKKVRTLVSNSPRNITLEKPNDDDVVEIVELDDAMDDRADRQSIDKTPTSSSVQNQNNSGWLKMVKNKNTTREVNHEQSRLVLRGDACSGGLDSTPSQTSHSPTLSASPDELCDVGSQPLEDDSAGYTKPKGHDEVQARVGSGVRLGAAPADKFGLRGPPLPLQEKKMEDGSVECPLCSRLFSRSMIEQHAATCDLV